MISIIDTSVLITLYHKNLIKYLNSIFNEVYVPITVEKQFLKTDANNRFRFLLNFYEENKWFKKCQTYDDDIISILSTNKKIHEGEREAIAQYKQIQAGLKIEEGQIACVIDERRARQVAANMNVKLGGTLYILAHFHFLGLIDYFATVENLKLERRYNDKIIDTAFKKVKTELGIQ